MLAADNSRVQAAGQEAHLLHALVLVSQVRWLCSCAVAFAAAARPCFANRAARAPQKAAAASAEAGELAELVHALRTQLHTARGLAAAAVAEHERSLQGDCAAQAQACDGQRNAVAASTPTVAGGDVHACSQVSTTGAHVTGGAAGQTRAELLGAHLSAGAHGNAAVPCYKDALYEQASAVSLDACASSGHESSACLPCTRQASVPESVLNMPSLQHCAELVASAAAVHAVASALRAELRAAVEEAGQDEVSSAGIPAVWGGAESQPL